MPNPTFSKEDFGSSYLRLGVPSFTFTVHYGWLDSRSDRDLTPSITSITLIIYFAFSTREACHCYCIYWLIAVTVPHSPLSASYAERRQFFSLTKWLAMLSRHGIQLHRCTLMTWAEHVTLLPRSLPPNTLLLLTRCSRCFTPRSRRLHGGAIRFPLSILSFSLPTDFAWVPLARLWSHVGTTEVL